jgi:hypothetical protein
MKNKGHIKRKQGKVKLKYDLQKLPEVKSSTIRIIRRLRKHLRGYKPAG